MSKLTAQETYYLELQIQIINSASKRSELNSDRRGCAKWQSLCNQEMIMLSILKELMLNNYESRTNYEYEFGKFLKKRDAASSYAEVSTVVPVIAEEDQ